MYQVPNNFACVSQRRDANAICCAAPRVPRRYAFVPLPPRRQFTRFTGTPFARAMAFALIPVILFAAFLAAVGPAEFAVRSSVVEALEYE
jgi:hypothetical protein